MKTVIIVNPSAHSGNAKGRAATQRQDIEQRLHSMLPISDISWIETEYPRHAVELAQRAAEQGYGCVIAAGGDGTASEVVNGLMNSAAAQRPLFGVLPWGTCNDLYNAIQLAAQQRQTQTCLPLDVARVSLNSLVRYSCLSVSVGLSSWANEQYQQAAAVFTRRFAHIPAAINTLRSYKFPSKVQLTVDNGRTQIKPMLFMAVNNTASVAGGVRFTPDARIDDGSLDVCRVAPVPLWRLAFLLAKAQLGLPLHSYDAEIIRVRNLRVQADRPFPIHIDGELVPEVESQTSRLDVHMIPGALNVLASLSAW